MAKKSNEQTPESENERELVDALVEIHKVRDDIAKFLATHTTTVDDLIACCGRNDWEADVAYDLRAAMSQLGCVLSTLVLWDNEVLPRDPDQILACVRRIEDEHARAGM